jgi:ketosteroid isomerase-like protein
VISRENAETLRHVYESDLDSDDLLRCLDPKVELYPGISAPDQDGRYVGREGWTEFIAGATEAWESVTIEPEERIDAPGNRILAIDRWVFRGRDGIEIERELPTVFTFRAGLIVRIEGFTDRAEALEAVGLAEDG